MTLNDIPAKDHPSTPASNPERKPAVRLKGWKDLLHYAAYFIGVGSMAFIAQSEQPKQLENALLAGGIAASCVVSRDWYKAKLDPDMASDPSALIALFSEMLHAGRAQANANAAHMKRVEFMQSDLVEAMRELNDLLRLEPDEVEQRLKAIQSAHFGSTLASTNVSPINVPNPLASNAINNNAVDSVTAEQSGVTLRQTSVAGRRPGFDA